MLYNPDNKTITTERLILRLFSIDDAETVTSLCNNINIYRGTLGLPYPYNIENALSWIPTHMENFDNNRSYEFAVTDQITGELYGCMGLQNNQSHRNGEAGYWVGEPYWGMGIATEALRAIIDFAFTHKEYHKVYASHYASNPASGRVMQKAGMHCEGTQTDQVLKDGRYETLILYGIINPSA
ncbi:MAG: GNAT family N-acetyltransferase [Oscillospiraceae bacterium]|jgi:RimJ/RimL family protein N-acetyltransferase|nr:GNAT family N-acetyltransferase [Oscillospiraceae bacterium]